MNTLGDAVTLFRREAIRYRRDRAYWVGQIVFPLAVVVFLGFGMNDVVRLPSGADYVGHLATGVLVLLVGSGAVGAGFSLIEDRETGFLRALLVAPVSRASIVLGKLVARLAASLLLVALLVAVLAVFTEVRPVHPAAVLLAVTAITANRASPVVRVIRFPSRAMFVFLFMIWVLSVLMVFAISGVLIAFNWFSIDLFSVCWIIICLVLWLLPVAGFPVLGFLAVSWLLYSLIIIKLIVLQKTVILCQQLLFKYSTNPIKNHVFSRTKPSDV